MSAPPEPPPTGIEQLSDIMHTLADMASRTKEMQETAEQLAEVAGQAMAQRDAANEIAETWSSVAVENAMKIVGLELEIEALRRRVYALGGRL